MDRVVLEPHRRQLRQELVGQTGVDEEPQAGRRVVDHQQLVEFVTDPLGRDDFEPWGQLAHRVDQVRRRDELIPGDEPSGAKHPQRVVTEADLRPDRRAQDTHGEIDRTVERVDQGGSVVVAGQLQRHGVHGEIAARQVGLDLVGEHHMRFA